MSKLVHIYPLRKGTLPELGDLTEDDVLREIGNATFSENPPETVLFMSCSTEDDSAHLFHEFTDRLGVYNSARVSFFYLPDVEQHIHRPAMVAHDYATTELFSQPLSVLEKKLKVHSRQQPHRVIYTFNSMVGLRTGKEVPLVDVQAIYRTEATPERDEVRKQHRFMDLSTEHNLNLLLRVIKEQNSTNNFIKFLKGEGQHAPIGRLVIQPLMEDSLKFLPQLRKELPGLVVYVFHGGDLEMEGVHVEEGESDDPKGMFETQSTFENEPDLPWVINAIAHQGESTWYGGLPKQSKTWALLCTAKSLLTQEPLFNDKRFYVPRPAARVIYLCPEASRGSLKKRLKMLGLMKFLYDPITNPEGKLFIRTLSSGEKIALTDPRLLELVKGADIFIDTAVRYLDGNENDVEDVKVVTENILNLIAVGARSVWVAHHAPKGFADASTMTLENMFRGSGEFGAALTNAYGLKQEEEATNKVRFHCITGRDLDEQIPDMILQGRPYLSESGNFKVIDADAEPFTGDRKPGPKEDSLKQQKIALAKSVDGSGQEKADAVNKEFGSKHDRRTIERWLKESEFDSTKENEHERTT